MDRREDKPERYVRWVRDVGFPIVVTLYLLLRLDLLIRENTAALWQLTQAVQALITTARGSSLVY